MSEQGILQATKDVGLERALTHFVQNVLDPKLGVEDVARQLYNLHALTVSLREADTRDFPVDESRGAFDVDWQAGGQALMRKVRSDQWHHIRIEEIHAAITAFMGLLDRRGMGLRMFGESEKQRLYQAVRRFLEARITDQVAEWPGKDPPRHAIEAVLVRCLPGNVELFADVARDLGLRERFLKRLGGDS